MQATDTEDVFALDLRVVTDASPDTPVACATDDGCDPTCASACSSD